MCGILLLGEDNPFHSSAKYVTHPLQLDVKTLVPGLLALGSPVGAAHQSAVQPQHSTDLHCHTEAAMFGIHGVSTFGVQIQAERLI